MNVAGAPYGLPIHRGVLYKTKPVCQTERDLILESLHAWRRAGAVAMGATVNIRFYPMK